MKVYDFKCEFYIQIKGHTNLKFIHNKFYCVKFTPYIQGRSLFLKIIMEIILLLVPPNGTKNTSKFYFTWLIS